MENTAYTSEQIRAMSKEMYGLYEDGNDAAEKVAKALAGARRAAGALEAGLTGSSANAARKEVGTAVTMYNNFKATL